MKKVGGTLVKIVSMLRLSHPFLVFTQDLTYSRLVSNLLHSSASLALLINPPASTLCTCYQG